MMDTDHWVLITGGARRIGAMLAIGLAERGFNIVIHHGHSVVDAEHTADSIRAFGREVIIVQADLTNSGRLVEAIFHPISQIPLFALINNAALFLPETLQQVSLDSWNEHLQINLTAPMQISQEFSRRFSGSEGRIINMLDWRALRPGLDHFSYTISKAGLAALTKSLARALAPRIAVNGLALGAILPPSDGNLEDNPTKSIPMNRWARNEEIIDAVNFLLTGPTYITGEIIHLDGGRNLI